MIFGRIRRASLQNENGTLTGCTLETATGRKARLTPEEFREGLVSGLFDISSLSAAAGCSSEGFKKMYGIKFEDLMEKVDTAFAGLRLTYPSAMVIRKGILQHSREGYGKVIQCTRATDAHLLARSGMAGKDTVTVAIETDKGIWLCCSTVLASNTSLPVQEYILEENEGTAGYGHMITESMLRTIPEKLMPAKEFNDISAICRKITAKDTLAEAFALYSMRTGGLGARFAIGMAEMPA